MSYLLFLASKRTELKTELESKGLSGKDLNMGISKRGGELWHALEDEEKKEWAEKAKEARDARPPKEKTDIKSKSSAKVKRAPSAWIIFSKAKRPSVVAELESGLGKTATEKKKSATEWATFDHRERLGRVSKRLGELWKALSDAEKAKFKEEPETTSSKEPETKSSKAPPKPTASSKPTVPSKGKARPPPKSDSEDCSESSSEEEASPPPKRAPARASAKRVR
jgi:hypothetical protein